MKHQVHSYPIPNNKVPSQVIQMNARCMPAALPLNKVQQTFSESSSPITNSTVADSMDSEYLSEDESSMGGFESPVQKQSQNQTRNPAAKNSRGETGWKKKVKTELCRFWLNGQACENSEKDQGCGFAHGQDEL